MTKKGKNKHDDNTFYFPGQKAQSEDSARNGFEKDQPDREEEEDEEEMQDQFIEFGASGKGVIPTIVHPPPDDGGMNGAATLEDGEEERGQWGNKLDFLFSCISVSVGLGNVWRFPYLCYQNGGGAFLLVYFIAMFLCGIPIFFQEVAIGQYLGSGGMTLVAQLCPILKGVGIATMCLVFYLDIYYCVIIAWTFFYFIAAFTAIPDLPWNTCDGWWNKETCFMVTDNSTADHISISNHTQMEFHKHNKTTTPVEEFWEHRVLQKNQPFMDLNAGEKGTLMVGLANGLGGMQWELVGTLFLSWVVVYLIIWKGLHSSGKIIWFTALFPYFVMAILLVRALTLPGAFTGLYYYVRVDWSRLLDGQVWIDGATQIFFAYSCGMGALPALGSYNKFHHNCYKDAIITCIVNTLTCLIAGVLVFSILGYMAHVQETGIDDVVASGPGLVFVTYPDLVLNLPGSVLWAVIFFTMLLVLGVDSEFCNVEALVTGLVDNWPQYLLKHRRLFTVGLCFFMFVCGIPMCAEGGVYLFKILDFYSCSGMSLLWVVFFQTIAIGWFFGAARFCDCVEQMTGSRPNIFFYLCWKYFAPAVMIGVFIFYIIQYEPVRYDDEKFPVWAEYLGLMISFSSMMWVPGYALYYLVTQPGSFKENLRDGFKPNIKRMKNTFAKPQTLHVSESGVGLLFRNESEYEMGRLHRPESFVTPTINNA
jgi:solute carrier family 6 GABA transporter-like protein 1